MNNFSTITFWGRLTLDTRSVLLLRHWRRLQNLIDNEELLLCVIIMAAVYHHLFSLSFLQLYWSCQQLSH